MPAGVITLLGHRCGYLPRDMASGENPRLRGLDGCGVVRRYPTWLRVKTLDFTVWTKAVQCIVVEPRLDPVAMFPVASLSFFVFFILFFALLLICFVRDFPLQRDCPLHLISVSRCGFIYKVRRKSISHKARSLVDKISSISHQLYIIMHAPNKLYSVLSFN
jgi:hypothetical protein